MRAVIEALKRLHADERGAEGLEKLLIIAAIALIALGLQRLAASAEGRRFMERALLGIPAVGQVIARFALVRFCRMLGTLLGAGVPLVPALRVAGTAFAKR